MPKIAKPLSDLEVRRLKEPGLHAVGEVPGLHLRVKPGEASRSWVLRTVVGVKRRDIGLGSYPDVTLSAARQRAREARDLIRNGGDPVQERRRLRSQLIAEQATLRTFRECAEACIEAMRPAWSNAKHAAQWSSTLEAHAYPVIGKMLVGDVTNTHVAEVLRPIWYANPETAKRLRGRIEKVLDWAKASGFREGENPATWRGNLSVLLPVKSQPAEEKHYAAVPYREVGALMARIRALGGFGARCLELVVLTGVRSGEARGARWSEIDLEARTWTVPGDRMKKRQTHVVALSDQAVDLLKALPRKEGSDLVFPAQRADMLIENYLIHDITKALPASSTR